MFLAGEGFVVGLEGGVDFRGLVVPGGREISWWFVGMGKGEGERGGGGLTCEGDMATVVVMVLVTVWEVVSEAEIREVVERRARARRDLVCMVGGVGCGWVDMGLGWCSGVGDVEKGKG